jgi:PEP-CTERM motif
MKHIFTSIALALILSLRVSGGASAGSITYSIQNYPADQIGASLSGFITTDGVIGDLAAADILSWSWTVTPAGGMPFTLSSDEMGSQVFLLGSVVASPTEITMAETLGPLNSFSLENITPGGELEYDRAGAGFDKYVGAGPDDVFWNILNPAMEGNDPWIIATASAVPEPSTLTMLGIAAVYLTGVAWGTARRRVCYSTRSTRLSKENS